MLNVYIGDIKSDNLVRFNDAWFDRHLKGLQVDDNIKYFMKKIDESIYIKEHKMYSRFDKELCISMKQLSTGCKTLINVYRFKDKIFDVIECGDNVIEEIFRLQQGNIYISAFYIIPEFNGTVNVYTNNGVKMMNKEQLSDYVYEYYKDR